MHARLITRFTGFRIAAVSALFAGLLSMVSARADTSVSGTYLVDDKPVAVKYVRSVKGDKFDDKDTTVIAITEKDASKSKDPQSDGMFGKLGGALILTITSDGELIGTQVVKGSVQFSSSGELKLTDFKSEGGKLSGKVATDGKLTFFKNTWQVDLTFSAAAP
jgi:hypothetical protein